MNRTNTTIRGVGFLVLSLLTFSLQDIAVKWIGGDYPVSEIVLFRAWQMPTLIDWAIMSGLGLVWASGMYLMARAYSLAQASVVAPYEYATLPINAVWGFVLWQEVPTTTTWIGALLTVFSGIYIVYREQREQNAAIRGSLPSMAAPAQ